MGENVIKITGKMGASQTFYVAGDGDYDTLKNIPIINLTGTDEEPILLNTLETGLYRLNGIYRVNASGIDKTQAESRLTIVKKVSDNDVYLQMLNPQGNIVEFYHITEADTLHKEVALSNLATTQDIPTKVSELENDSKYITEAELKTFGYATEEFVRNQGYLTEETDPTVPDHVKNITEADINKWNEEYQLPVASQTTLGGIKVGNNLSIGQDGTLNAEKSTQSYTELTNKPKINNVELDGEKSLDDLGIQAQGNYATKEELPTKTSQLENDSNFISEIPVASTSTLGGIKVGDNLEITADGVLNALGGGSAGITVLEGTEEAPVNLQNLTEAGLYFVKNCYIPSSLYAKRREDIFIINLLSWTTNTMTQTDIKTDRAGRFYWSSRWYNTATKEWNADDFTSRYNDIGQLNDDQNYYNGRAILSYYGKKTKLETTNKNDLVEAINEINAKISSRTLATNLAEVQGYDATKTQVLKNINGVLTWTQE